MAVGEKSVDILLVEDDDAHAELILRMFQAGERPVRLSLARSVREAHDWLAVSVPDLVIADLLLPDGRGVEVVPPPDGERFPAYPVIVMTSHGDEKIAVAAVKAGALDYVIKSAESFADMPRIAERALREWEQVVARKRTEEQLQKLQHELLRVSRMSAMGELGTAIAHELNQPITAVMNYVQASRRLLIAGDGIASEEALELMNEAVTQAERAGAILRHLRRLVEKGELQRTDQDLNEVVREAAKLALANTAEEYIHTGFEFEDGLPRVFIDKIQVQEVVFNLVRNAVEALDRSPRREITIKTYRSGDAVTEVAVQDTGPGVEPDLVDHLFTKYFSTKEHGMGVGLSVCQSIIGAHGGRLWLTVTPGGGATFHFTVPIAGAGDGE